MMFIVYRPSLSPSLPLSLRMPLPQDEECARQLQFEFIKEKRSRSRDVIAFPQTTAFLQPFSQPTVSTVWRSSHFSHMYI